MKNEIIVQKMITYAEKIMTYTAGMSYEDFMATTMVIEACVFNLSQIGELANKVDHEFADQHKEIQWKQIYGLRNRIVHDYDGVNLKLVWEIINGNLDQLIEQLNTIR